MTSTLAANILHSFTQMGSPLTIDKDGARIKELGHVDPYLNGRYWTVLTENGQYGRESRALAILLPADYKQGSTQCANWNLACNRR